MGAHFLDNLVHAAVHGIVLSWAVPGHSARGHVNTRTNDYIIGELLRRGFVYQPDVTRHFRKCSWQCQANCPSNECSWLTQSLLVFCAAQSCLEMPRAGWKCRVMPNWAPIRGPLQNPLKSSTNILKHR